LQRTEYVRIGRKMNKEILITKIQTT